MQAVPESNVHAVPTKQCLTCSQSLPQKLFSKTNWKKTNKHAVPRRCKSCTPAIPQRAAATKCFVFMDVAAGLSSDPAVKPTAIGRMIMELFTSKVPKTAENFRALCAGTHKGKSGTQLHYKGCPFHRIIPGFMIQGGDITKQNGSGGESIYGRSFPDENFKLRHDSQGILSMANCGPNSNSSQFFITTKASPHLNNKHCVFGKVVAGLDVVQRLEQMGTRDGAPICNALIFDCGEVTQHPPSKTVNMLTKCLPESNAPSGIKAVEMEGRAADLSTEGDEGPAKKKQKQLE
jgi:cyclophilin family peptidyl-prolyl cis-trans isomerase